MSDPVDPRPSPVSGHGWDGDRKVRFLHHLSEKGDVRAAAARVGMSRQSAYMQRRRDPVFAQGWAAALVLARTAAEEMLATRALDGVEEEVWFRGELVGVRKRFDGRLLLAHLARLDALTDTVAGEQAERFDEMLALVAGERPDKGFFRCSRFPNEPDPVLPLDRAEYARLSATFACGVEHAVWEEAFENMEAEKEDEPVPDYDAYHAGFLDSWDTWQGCAFMRVDAALEEGDRAETPLSPAERVGGGPVAASVVSDMPTPGPSHKREGDIALRDHPPAEYKSLTGPAPDFNPGLCKPCQPVGSSERGHGWATERGKRERKAEFAVIGGAGRRGHPPTPPTTAPADPFFGRAGGARQ